MVIHMRSIDRDWEKPYFAAVPALLTEYGAAAVAGSRDVRRIEGDFVVPDRMAVLSFPSLDAIDRFMADPRYLPFREMRESGATSQIFVFENAVRHEELV